MPLRRRTFLLALCAACMPPAAWPHHVHGGEAAARKSEGATPVRINVEDTPLVDSEGRGVRMRTDVLAGKVVVVNFVYTTCTTICPIFTATMVELQKRLGARAGRDVQLVTVTVDPLRDTPRRLKEYAARHGTRPDGWVWLTGTKPNVDAVNKAFGAYTANIDDHPPMVVVGDAGAGTWTRFYGFPGATELEAGVNHLLGARARAS